MPEKDELAEIREMLSGVPATEQGGITGDMLADSIGTLLRIAELAKVINAEAQQDALMDHVCDPPENFKNSIAIRELDAILSKFGS